MAQLVGLIVSEDELFRKQMGRLLRSGAVPVSVVEDPSGARRRAARSSSSSTSGAMRLRPCRPSSGSGPARRAPASSPCALTADPDLILQAMRAGANEFFIWPPADETFHGAITPRRVAP